MYVFRNAMKTVNRAQLTYILREVSVPWSGGQLILGNPLSNWQYHGLACGLYSGLPYCAISRAFGYPRVLLSTDFDYWRFAKY